MDLPVRLIVPTTTATEMVEHSTVTATGKVGGSVGLGDGIFCVEYSASLDAATYVAGFESPPTFSADGSTDVRYRIFIGGKEVEALTIDFATGRTSAGSFVYGFFPGEFPNPIVIPSPAQSIEFRVEVRAYSDGTVGIPKMKLTPVESAVLQ